MDPVRATHSPPRPQGRILHLQRLSTEDGPGIRTTVFFKGCPLHCAWCHNPESISPRLQTQWFAVRCIGCKTCVDACPNGCLTMTEAGLVIDRERCEACGKCAEACPSGALEALGRTVAVEELLAELLKDRAYYDKSGGGVTLSGGEPTFQPDLSESLLRGLKEQGISTALDTCGLCSTHTLDRLLPYTDLVLFDLKLFAPAAHREYTGVSNTQILENLEHVRDFIRSQDRRIGLWIRTPLIPRATDSEENLSAIGRYLSTRLDGTLARWELCAFNNLCRDQYIRLGLEWKYARTPLMTHAELAHCEWIAKTSSLHPELVLATGATRAAEPD
ncbi:MAG TPA: glycyl-radical enzyme activating protein [Anaerolineales bacterium]|nr:glycyl-radical enzyme activating protein [Anaerolineales bacterium]